MYSKPFHVWNQTKCINFTYNPRSRTKYQAYLNASIIFKWINSWHCIFNICFGMQCKSIVSRIVGGIMRALANINISVVQYAFLVLIATRPDKRLWTQKKYYSIFIFHFVAAECASVTPTLMKFTTKQIPHVMKINELRVELTTSRQPCGCAFTMAMHSLSINTRQQEFGVLGIHSIGDFTPQHSICDE